MSLYGKGMPHAQKHNQAGDTSAAMTTVAKLQNMHAVGWGRGGETKKHTAAKMQISFIHTQVGEMLGLDIAQLSLFLLTRSRYRDILASKQ